MSHKRTLVLVSGSRDNDDQTARNFIFSKLDETEIRARDRGCKIHVMAGGARGTDQIAYDWAVLNNHIVLTMQAWWELYKRRTGRMIAGTVRNAEMANFLLDSVQSGMYEYSEQLIFKRDGSRNRGTEDMRKRLLKMGLLPNEFLVGKGD